MTIPNGSTGYYQNHVDKHFVFYTLPNSATPPSNKLIESKNVNYGIKLCYKNFGFNGKFYQFHISQCSA
ncbi:MAG: hypothetical protein U0K71_08090 [Paludibacteraceae bacterium]|nr:hypothetical protein [Paludibacteraceae bacterium]